jgi:PKD repeat protein
MKDTVTKFSKLLSISLIAILSLVFTQQVNAQKNNCNAEFAFTSNGTKVAFKTRTNTNLKSITYKWEFGNNHTSNRPNPEFNFQKSGTYKVCLTVASRDGKCKETVCKRVTVKFDPCARLQAQFRHKIDGRKAAFASTNKSKHLNYLWTINGRKVSKQQAFRHTFKKEGKYNVCLVVKTKNGKCQSRICKVIVIKKTDPCKRLRVNFTSRQKGTKAAFFAKTNSKKAHYLWAINGRKVSEKEAFRIDLKKEGKYNVCLVVKVRGTKCVKHICKVIEVKRPNPCRIVASFKYRVDGHKVALFNTSKGKDLKYQWTIDGKEVSNRENHITKLRAGKHRVCLTIGNGKCRKTYCTIIVIREPKRNNGGTNLEVDETVADNTPTQPEEVTAENHTPKIEMSIYPNPAQEVLNLKVEGVAQASIIISNFSGTVFYNSAATSINANQAQQINISHLPQGYYIAKVVSADGKTKSELKFYKQ